ncbi:MAG: PorP/SprF family type IX secretion system membrane protein, partial [Bacteroidales bacterium]|nr:PorP/SprF family type IX secretion system membrane protein [Bacteroidales bacterium]
MGSVSAQDIHFSQFNTNPVYLNPAQAGFYFARFRATANHRSQWRAVTVPFNSFIGGVDFKVFNDKYSRNIIGAGVMAYYDQAGDSKFGTSSGALALSYIRSLSQFNNNYLSFGMKASYNDRSYDYTALMFDNQFNGKTYDPSIHNGESLLYRGFNYFDLSAGVHWFMKPSSDLSFNAGFALSHLNTPEQSFLDNSEVKLDRKLVVYGNAEISTSNKQSYRPGLYFARQGTYTEIIAGSYIDFDSYSATSGFSIVSAGLFFRPVDAAILIVGFEYAGVDFGISYDVNYSGLRKASSFRGGFELSAIYLLNKKKRSNNKKK